MTRYLFAMDGQKQWKYFSFSDYKFNVRLFRKWLQLETDIMSESPEYQSLPQECDPNTRRKQSGRGRRKAGGLKRTFSTSASESPMKRQCVVNDAFTDDDEEVIIRARVQDDGDDDGDDDGSDSSTSIDDIE